MELKPGYKQTEVGMIPEDWEAVTIGDVATFSGGSQPPRATFKFAPTEGYIRLIQIRDYKTDAYASYIPELLARKRCTAKDIMIGRYGPPIFQILRGIEGAYNVALLKATPSQRIDYEFFFNILKQDKLFNLIDSLSRRTSGQTGVEMPALKGFWLPLPPLPEQRSIATALSDIDKLLQSLDQLIAKKRDIKQATMQQLLTGKTRLPGFGEGRGYKQTEIGVIPDDWVSCQVSKVTVTHKQGYYTKDKYVEDGIRLVRITDLYNPRIDYGTMPMLRISEKDFEQYKVVKDDFLIARSGAIGRYGIVENDTNAIFGSYIIRFNFEREELLNRFFGYLFETQMIWKQLLSITQGSSNININAGNIKELTVPLPTLPEQAAIATILTDMDTEIIALEQRRDKTRALKQGMMQELLTGKTRLI